MEKYLYSAKGVVGYTNQLGQVTRTDYDVAGRSIAVTNANLEVVSFTYNAAGDRRTLTDGKNQVTSWGYDSFGRATSETNAASAEVFRFQYDANNRQTNRWSAAKGSTVYSYDANGNRTFVNYPASPDLTFTYDALNRVTNLVDAVGTTAFTFNTAGLLASEDGPWASDTVTYTYANRMRSGFNLQAPNASDWTEGYAYDSAKRLTSLTSPAGTFGYNYIGSCGCPAGSLVNRVTLPNGSMITNNFDGMARLLDTTLKNSGGTALSSRAYTYNLASWRTKETRLDGSFVDYAYDNLGQVTNAVGKEAGGVTNRSHESYAYAYDKAGNLATRTNNALVQSFGVNSKNELTSVSRSGTLTVAGFTTASANSVTVNGNGATRYTDWTFAKSGFSLINGVNAFTAVATDTLGRTDTNVSTVNLPATVSFTYDANGSLTSDGTRGLDYDDENQLIRVTVTNNWKTEFVYDAQQRRRIRREYVWSTLYGSYLLSAEIRYIFDGNLEIQQRDANNLPLLTLTRGRDLGGGLENAGGIGGLLARSDHSTLNIQNSYFFSDGNGNVIALANAYQLLVAKYLYDSFGNPIMSSGPLADVNCYQFSSRERHEKSGLIFFKYRVYDPNLQRWLNTDPKGIDGGINLFAYVHNDPLDNFDPWGLKVDCGFWDGFKMWASDWVGRAKDAAKVIGQACKDRLPGIPKGGLGSAAAGAAAKAVGAAADACKTTPGLLCIGAVTQACQECSECEGDPSSSDEERRACDKACARCQEARRKAGRHAGDL